MIVPGNGKDTLIQGSCLPERFFIRRYLGKTLVDGLRDILKNARWVVGFRVYIEWVVPWFRKGQGQAETVKLRRLKKRFKSKPVWRMACFG